MKNKVIFPALLFLFAFCNPIFSQSLPVWYDMDTIAVHNVSYFRAFTKGKSFSLTHSLKEIKASELRYFILQVSNDTISESSNHEIVCARANVGSDEYIFVDLDFNKKFTDNEAFKLGIPFKYPTLTYNDFSANYPTDIGIPIDFKYNYIQNNQVFTLTANMKINVKAQLDSISNELFYTDQLRMGHKYNLQSEIELDKTPFTITYPQDLYYNTIHHFTIFNGISKSKVGLNQDFSSSNNDFVYQIKEFDFVNKRILIQKQDKRQKLVLNSTPLYANEPKENTLYSGKINVAHFWGPWCGPCVKNFPKLVDFHHRNSDIPIVGFCADDEVYKGRKMATEKGLNWPQQFISFSETTVEGCGFDIGSFPKYVIVNSNQEILGIYSDIESLEKGVIAARNL